MDLLKEHVLNYRDQYSDIRPSLADFSIEQIAAQLSGWLATERKRCFEIMSFARNFYLSMPSDIDEKEKYYSALVNENFFVLLNDILRQGSTGEKYCVVYTIGKFSGRENAGILEDAYETDISINEPLLLPCCLFELSWLKSKKAPNYIRKLQNDNWIVSKILLLYYYGSKASTTSAKAINQILTNKDVRTFISPEKEMRVKEEIEIVLSGLDQFFRHFCYHNKDAKINYREYYRIAQYYFLNRQMIGKQIGSGTFDFVAFANELEP